MNSSAIKVHLLLAVMAAYFVYSATAAEKKLPLTGSLWQELKTQNVNNFYICGSPYILATRKSIAKDFMIGEPKKGYIFTLLPGYEQYWEVLKNHNLDAAKITLSQQFSKANLLEVMPSGAIRNLGSPKEVALPFTSTVKDCLEGAKTSLGMSCSNVSMNQVQCCSEKFSGPILTWKDGKTEFRLFYSPDPSIHLKVPGEKRHRYCNVMDLISL